MRKIRRGVLVLLVTMLMTGTAMTASAEEVLDSNIAYEEQVDAQGGVQEEAEVETAAESTISLSGTQARSIFYLGKVVANENNLYSYTCRGLRLTVRNEGGQTTYPYSGQDWVDAGVKGELKNKTTGMNIPLDGSSGFRAGILPLGTYELFITYKEEKLKASEFTVQPLEECVNETVTLETPVNYAWSTDHKRDAITKFVPESSDTYTFTTETTGDIINLYMRVEDSAGEAVNYKAGTKVSAKLKAGESYYITMELQDGFKLSVTRAVLADIAVTGEAQYTRFHQGHLRTIGEGVLLDVCQGLKLEETYTNGTSQSFEYYKWSEMGVVPIVTDKSSGKPLDFSTQKEIPVGSYDVAISYKEKTAKACEFTVHPLSEMADQTITTSATASYEKAQHVNRRTVTKFIPEVDETYRFTIQTGQSANYMTIMDDNAHFLASGSRVNKLRATLKKGTTYYLVIEESEKFTASVEAAGEIAVSSVKIDGAQDYTRFYEGKVPTNPRRVIDIAAQGLTRLVVEYTDGTKETIYQYMWIDSGVVPIVKDRKTGEVLDLSGDKKIPLGDYQMTLTYKGKSVIAGDFTVAPLSNMADQELTTTSSVSYEKADKVNRETISKFVPKTTGTYVFTMKLEKEAHLKNSFIVVLNADAKEVKRELEKTEIEVELEGGKSYYFMMNMDEKCEGSVTRKTTGSITSKKVVAVPTKKQTIFKATDVKTCKELQEEFLKLIQVKATYSDGTEKTINLSQVDENPDFGIKLNTSMDGADNSDTKLDAGVYEYKVWFSDDTIPDKVAVKVPFYVYDGYKDVNSNDWYHDYVAIVSANKIMTGLTSTTFAPADNLARAQFAVILHRLNGEPEVEYTDKFKDVVKGQWYTDAVIWANSIGIVNGYTDTGLFGVGDNINREQMAVMMHRYATYKKYDISPKADLSKFKDAASVNEFAKEGMEWAVGAGIITGTDNSTKLNPQGNANRAECATIITRFIEKYEP